MKGKPGSWRGCTNAAEFDHFLQMDCDVALMADIEQNVATAYCEHEVA
jgi:hypothetical protein